MAGEGGNGFSKRGYYDSHIQPDFSMPRLSLVISHRSPPPSPFFPRLSRGGKKVVCGAVAHPPLLFIAAFFFAVFAIPLPFSRKTLVKRSVVLTREFARSIISFFKRNGVFFKAGWKYNKRNFSTNESDPFWIAFGESSVLISVWVFTCVFSMLRKSVRIIVMATIDDSISLMLHYGSRIGRSETAQIDRSNRRY